MKSGKPKDFSFVEIRQYGDRYTAREFSTYGELLGRLLFGKGRRGPDAPASHWICRSCWLPTQERIARRLDNQHRELEESADREKYKIYGDLLATNMYSIQKGDRRAVVQNYYEEKIPRWRSGSIPV